MTNLTMSTRTLPRDPEPGTGVESKNKAELSIKITRKDGTVEEITGIPVTFNNEELKNG